MSTQTIGWAPGNAGLKMAFIHPFCMIWMVCQSGCYPCLIFMASKFDAFHDRGSKDPRTSHDIEDIVYLLNHVSDIREQILASDRVVRDFLKDTFQTMLKNDLLQEAIIANLYNDYDAEQFNKIRSILKDTTKGVD